jgi:hypothetical protein
MTIAARIANIPTIYKGVQFRSRLEAKWAAFFDLLGWRWHYEPLDLDGWIPDFLIEPFNGFYCSQCRNRYGNDDNVVSCIRCNGNPDSIPKKRVLVEVKPIVQRDEAITQKIERALGTSVAKAVLYDNLDFDALLVGLFPQKNFCGVRIGWLMSDAWVGGVLIDALGRYDISAEVQVFGGRLSGWRDGGHLNPSCAREIDDKWKCAGNAVQWSAR